MVEIPTIAITLIVGSIVGLVVGTVLLALWLVAIIPTIGFWTAICFAVYPVLFLLSHLIFFFGSPFFILVGGPVILAFLSWKLAVMMLTIGVLAT